MRAWITLVLIAYAAPSGAQQQLGHKLVGLAPLRAGALPPPGLYLGDQWIWYQANRLWGRDGSLLPTQGLEVSAFATAIGLGVSYEPIENLFLSTSFALPLTRLLVDADRQSARIDTFGLSDLFLELVQLGGRVGRVDLSLSYALYVPTGLFEPGGVGEGQFSHQFTVGGALYFDRERTTCASLQASYNLNQRKLNVDLLRGDTVQLEGGVSAILWRVLEVGLSAYALWQVRDDQGSFIPPPLHGLRERVVGVGPEVSVRIKPIGAQVRVRYARDLVGAVHPEGQLVVVGVTFLLKKQ